MSLVKMRSYWIRVGPNPVTDVLIREKKTETHTREAGQQAETGVMQL